MVRIFFIQLFSIPFFVACPESMQIPCGGYDYNATVQSDGSVTSCNGNITSCDDGNIYRMVCTYNSISTKYDCACTVNGEEEFFAVEAESCIDGDPNNGENQFAIIQSNCRFAIKANDGLKQQWTK